MLVKKFAIVVAMLALVGCAQPVKQAFNKEAAGALKTMGLAQKPNQERYEAVVIAHPGVNFGLIGGLIAAADMEAKSTRLTQAIDPEQTRLQALFTSKLHEQLGQAGYETRVVPVGKDVDDNSIPEAVKKAGAVDSIVAVNLAGRYIAAGPGTDYFPFVVAEVKMLDAKTGDLLYGDVLTYGYTFPSTDSVHFPSDARFRFADIDKLVADPAKTREGLQLGVDAIIHQIVADLRKN